MEEQMNRIIRSFAVIGILISCLGIFGLSSLTTEQRTKEIGIRKVHGASVSRILHLLTKEHIILMLFAALTAFPAAWFIMNRWLESFAYRTEIGYDIFLWSRLLVMASALFTVSFLAVRAALADPVKSLRYE